MQRSCCAVGLRDSGCAAAHLLTTPYSIAHPPTRHRPWQAEDSEGETPLGAAANHGKLRDALVGIAKGELSPEDFMLE